MKCSDVLVFPSYREGFPNVPMQAAAMGLPVIASNINGCNEIVFNDENGLLINAKSSEDLYNSIIKIYNDCELRIKLSFNARKSILNKFSQKKVWEILHEEYIQLFNQYC